MLGTIHRCKRGSHIGSVGAFTLLELIVVIGIVAVMVGVLLPVVSRARALSSTISCKANLNQLFLATTQYNIDYGSYPFGFIFAKQNLTNGRPADPTDSSHITWYSLLDTYLTSDASPVIEVGGLVTPLRIAPPRRQFAQAFRCPSVPGTFQQQITYAQHGVVMPHMTLELPASFRSPNMPPVWPAKLNLVNPDTALFWDTPVYTGFKYDSTFTPWGTSHTTSGIAPFCTMIDDNTAALSSENGLLCHPEFTERRFRGPGADRFAFSTNPLKVVSGPIAWPSDATIQALGYPFASLNTDHAGGSLGLPGNARFRHEGLGCNVLFVDGSVRTLFLDPTTTVAGSGSNTYIMSDFKRYMLMTKWPAGIRDTGTYPTN